MKLNLVRIRLHDSIKAKEEVERIRKTNPRFESRMEGRR